MSCCWSCSGRLFHSVGQAVAKQRSPNWLRDLLTTHVRMSTDRKVTCHHNLNTSRVHYNTCYVYFWWQTDRQTDRQMPTIRISAFASSTAGLQVINIHWPMTSQTDFVIIPCCYWILVLSGSVVSGFASIRIHWPLFILLLCLHITAKHCTMTNQIWIFVKLAFISCFLKIKNMKFERNIKINTVTLRTTTKSFSRRSLKSKELRY